MCRQPLSSAFSDQFAWKESGPIIADTRTSVSTQLWNPMKSELLNSNNAELFGPLGTTREYSLQSRGEIVSGMKVICSVGKQGGCWWVGGGEHGSNEWVGQTTITTVHCPAEDHDTSPANRSAQTSPSSLFNISCGVHGVCNAHRHAHNVHARKQVHRTYP